MPTGSLVVLFLAILALGGLTVFTWWWDRRRMRREAADARAIRIYMDGIFKRDVQ